MRRRAQSGNDTSSFGSGPDDTTCRESHLRLPNNPHHESLIPFTSVLSSETRQSKSMSAHSANSWAMLAAQFHAWLRVMLIAYSFVIDDIRTTTLPWQADIYVDVSLILCILLFLLDITIRVAKFPDYLWSLYFIFDLLSTAAVVSDIHFIVSTRYSPCTSGLLRAQKAAGKAARLGSSSLDLLAFIKKRVSVKQGGLLTMKTEDEVWRMLHVHSNQVVPDNSAVCLKGNPCTAQSPAIKCESSDTLAKRSKRRSTLGRLYHLSSQQTALPEQSKKYQHKKPSKIGERLAKRIVVQVVLTALAITLVNIWITDASRFSYNQTRAEYGLKLLLDAKNSPRYGDFVKEFLERNTDDNDMQYVVKVVIPGFTEWERTSPNRSTDLYSVSLSSAYISLNCANQNCLLAIFSLGQTLILCSLTLSIVVWLNADINN